jgi:hypothetical protein
MSEKEIQGYLNRMAQRYGKGSTEYKTIARRFGK